MKTFQIEGNTVEVPDIVIVEPEPPVFRIAEGEWSGVTFTISELRIDDQDEKLLHCSYDIVESEQQKEVTPDDIKPIIQNFILKILHDQMRRLDNDEPLDSE